MSEVLLVETKDSTLVFSSEDKFTSWLENTFKGCNIKAVDNERRVYLSDSTFIANFVMVYEPVDPPPLNEQELEMLLDSIF